MVDNVRITDPRALKALAHPGRNRILERLQVHGPATATECAEVAGMSPSACSYHLRLLEKYGFVEEADDTDRPDGRTDGRERLWRAKVHAWTSAPDESGDPQQARAVDMALTRVLLDSSDEKVLAWVDQLADVAPEWRDAWLISNSVIVVGAEEVDEVAAKIQAVLSPYLVRERDHADLPEGARLVHAAVRLTPQVNNR